jgi:hypothetical protein
MQNLNTFVNKRPRTPLSVDGSLRAVTTWPAALFYCLIRGKHGEGRLFARMASPSLPKKSCQRKMIGYGLPGRTFDQGAVVLRRDQNHNPNLLPLFGIAIIIPVVFAWTYIR